MRNISTGTFNKEKLIFLAGSAVVAVGVYLFLTSGPIPLVPVPPIDYGESKPAPLVTPPIPEKIMEDYYVVDGKVSNLIDKRTNKLVNRDRVSPFEPFKTEALASGKNLAQNNKVNAPPPPPPHVDPPPAKEEKKTWDPKTAKAEVEFMGVMTMDNGETFGLLKPTDGDASPMRVKEGSKIEANGEKYTVTKIEPQAIWVTDSDDRPYMLKDMMFEQTDEADVADASKPAKAPKDSPDPKKVADTPKPPKNGPKSNQQAHPPRRAKPGAASKGSLPPSN